MLTTIERDDRAPYRPFRTEVAAIVPLTPGVTRVTLTGDELVHFGTDGLDQRIKLLLPLLSAPVAEVLGDDWYASWRALPDARRNPMRTFTVRAVRPGELDVDFALHDDDAHGPAAQWVGRAGAGDPLVVVGPDARSRHSATGIDYRPGTASRVLLVGDETALPAVGAILATPGAAPHATAVLELGDARDVGALDPCGADVRVLTRDPDAPGDRLYRAVTDWLAEHPELASAGSATPLAEVDVDHEPLWETGEGEGFYAWLAGEAAVIKRLRRLLVTESGVDRRRVSFMGYWRRGRAEQN